MEPERIDRKEDMHKDKLYVYNTYAIVTEK